MHRNISIVFISVSISVAMCAQAQTMYRCGKTYQDRPCDNGQEGKVIGSSEAPRVTAQSVVNASCARRGEEAQKIVWSREAGALQDKLMADARTAEQRKLIVDVYAIRGTSSSVRMAIEADCARDMEKSAQMAAMMGSAAVGPAGNNQRSAASSSAEVDRRAEKAARAEDAVARKRAQCDYLKQRLEHNRGSQRGGGDVVAMEQLNQERRVAENEMRAADCEGGQRSMHMQ